MATKASEIRRGTSESSSGADGGETCVTAAAAAVAGALGDKKTKKVKVRVKQAYIDALLARYELGPPKPFPGLSEEQIGRLPLANQERMRALLANVVALERKSRAEEQDIIRQYREKGYAEVETDEEEGPEN